MENAKSTKTGAVDALMARLETELGHSRKQKKGESDVPCHDQHEIQEVYQDSPRQ